MNPNTCVDDTLEKNEEIMELEQVYIFINTHWGYMEHTAIVQYHRWHADRACVLCDTPEEDMGLLYVKMTFIRQMLTIQSK